MGTALLEVHKFYNLHLKTEPREQGPRGLGVPASSVLEEKPPNKQNGAITSN